MAEPVFDDHPLEEYFRRAGEAMQSIPGSAPEFLTELDEQVEESEVSRFRPERLPSVLLTAIQLANSLCHPRPTPESAFAERFKYDVISSSLLSTSIAAPTSATRRSFSPEIPGRLEEDSNHAVSQSTDKHEISASPLSDFHWLIVLVLLAAVMLIYEYYFVAIFLIGGATYNWHTERILNEKTSTLHATLRTVNDLILAGNVWDSAVNEAVAIIEKEERSIFYGPASPHSPSSGIRVTLQSSLHTTQVQCDNVRQLLSALTDPSQLSQLSEMYAPASPMRQGFSMFDHPRPVSLPIRRQRTISANADKRSTWNGSYASLALAGSPTKHLYQRRQKRESDLSALFRSEPSKHPSTSAPASPQVPLSLQDVQEEEDDSSPESPLTQNEYFGAALLDFQRKRRSAGMETFGVPPPSYSSQSSRSHRSSASIGYSSNLPTIPSASRFTTVHTTRHPLSLSGLQVALHSALQAKRYACSHLLALRFDEDEDDSYWEDVRSVMALLASTFEDASSRLTEALNQAEQRRVRDERPSPERMPAKSAPSQPPPARTVAEIVSFAPMPSHLTRFAAHVDAISNALNEAREHIEQCVVSLREPVVAHNNTSGGVDAALASQDHPAFQAYDRLRKELGFALRECERGRERLLDIVSGPRPAISVEETDAYVDGSPGLGQDNGSDISEKMDPSSPALLETDISRDRMSMDLDTILDREEPLDDATQHLLLTASSRHLPPPGVEQVFEADTANNTPFARERSKLSREERIKLAKARRDSTTPEPPSSFLSPRAPSGENCGPGGEVVQELKDVIWKVSEKRRRLVERDDSRSEQPPAVVNDTPRTADVESSEAQAS